MATLKRTRTRTIKRVADSKYKNRLSSQRQLVLALNDLAKKVKELNDIRLDVDLSLPEHAELNECFDKLLKGLNAHCNSNRPGLTFHKAEDENKSRALFYLIGGFGAGGAGNENRSRALLGVLGSYQFGVHQGNRAERLRGDLHRSLNRQAQPPQQPIPFVFPGQQLAGLGLFANAAFQGQPQPPLHAIHFALPGQQHVNQPQPQPQPQQQQHAIPFALPGQQHANQPQPQPQPPQQHSVAPTNLFNTPGQQHANQPQPQPPQSPTYSNS